MSSKRDKLAERLAQANKQNDKFNVAEATLIVQPTGFSPKPPTEIAAAVQEVVTPNTGEPYDVTAEQAGVLENPFNARHIYEIVRINDLAQSIARKGQLQRCIATIRDGKYVLADGEYRLRAIRSLKLSEIKLVVYPNLTDLDLYEISYIANEERSQHNAIDNAISWSKALEKGLYPNETALAEFTKKSGPTVNKTLAIMKLAPALIEFIKQDPSKYSLSALYELVQFQEVAGEAKAMEWLPKIRDEEAGREKINEARNKLAAPTRKKKENARQYKIPIREGQSVKQGFIKEFNSGKISMELTVTDPGVRSKILEELREKFGAE